MKSFFYKIISCIGNFLLGKKNKLPDRVTKILIISLYFRGDALFHTPVLSMLKFLYPNSEIQIWTKKRNEDIFKNNPNADKLIIFDQIRTSSYNEENSFALKEKIKFIRKLNKEKYSVIFDLTGKYSTAIFTFLAGAKYTVGINYNGFGFFYDKFYDIVTYHGKEHLAEKYLSVIKFGLSITDQSWKNISSEFEHNPVMLTDKNEVASIRESLIHKGVEPEVPLICLHTTAGWDAKCLPKDTFVELIDLFHSRMKCSIIIIGSSSDEPNINGIISQTKVFDEGLTIKYLSPSLTQTAALISLCDVFVGSDSVPLHIAGAVNTPCIGLFGPTNPGFSMPKGENNITVYHKLHCSPPENDQYCTRKGGWECPLYECMNGITANEIYISAVSILDKTKKSFFDAKEI